MATGRNIPRTRYGSGLTMGQLLQETTDTYLQILEEVAEGSLFTCSVPDGVRAMLQFADGTIFASEYSGSEDLVVTAPSSGGEDGVIEVIIEFFTEDAVANPITGEIKDYIPGHVGMGEFFGETFDPTTYQWVGTTGEDPDFEITDGELVADVSQIQQTGAASSIAAWDQPAVLHTLANGSKTFSRIPIQDLIFFFAWEGDVDSQDSEALYFCISTGGSNTYLYLDGEAGGGVPGQNFFLGAGSWIIDAADYPLSGYLSMDATGGNTEFYARLEGEA